MKEVLTLAAVVTLFCKYGVRKAHAWSTDVHMDIVTSALELMEKEKKLRPAAFYKDWKDQLLAGAAETDKPGDIDKGPGKHYYASMNAKGKELEDDNGYFKNRLGEYLPSARTLYRANYTAAVSYYKSGNIEKAMVSLGRAIHFVSDMGCTPHVANMKYADKANNVHYAFEKHANNIIGKYRPEKFDKRLIKSWSGEGFENPLNKLAAASNKHAPMVAALDPLAFEGAVKDMAPVTAQNVMALLLRFYDDCRGDAGFMLSDGKRYAFKNEETGLMLTVGAKGLTLEPADKDKEQKLTVILKDGGTVAFKVKDGGFVNSKCSGYDYVKIDGQPALYRLAALGNRRFRITVGSADYERVLENSQAGKLVFSKFVPGNTAQNWILQ